MNDKPSLLFCEENIQGWIAQPANTWSHFVYLPAVAYMIYFLARKKILSAFMLMAPLVSILLSIGSSIFHATNSHLWQTVDQSGMTLVISWIIGYQFRRKYGVKAGWISFLSLSFGIILLNVLALLNETVTSLQLPETVFGIMVLSSVVYEVYWMIKTKYSNWKVYAAGPIVLAISWGIWWLDLTGIWCDPNLFHVINGHAIWHVGSCLSLFLVVMSYFIQESGKQNEN